MKGAPDNFPTNRSPRIDLTKKEVQPEGDSVADTEVGLDIEQVGGDARDQIEADLTSEEQAPDSAGSSFIPTPPQKVVRVIYSSGGKDDDWDDGK